MFSYHSEEILLNNFTKIIPVFSKKRIKSMMKSFIKRIKRNGNQKQNRGQKQNVDERGPPHITLPIPNPTPNSPSPLYLPPPHFSYCIPLSTDLR